MARYEVHIDSDHDAMVLRAAVQWVAEELTDRLRHGDPSTRVQVWQIGLGGDVTPGGRNGARVHHAADPDPDVRRARERRS
jgi:hypothetical protein